MIEKEVLHDEKESKSKVSKYFMTTLMVALTFGVFIMAIWDVISYEPELTQKMDILFQVWYNIGNDLRKREQYGYN